ncbi:MAG: hypothetical protein ACRYGR_01930 [Janthinobacterium lividum]
MKKDASDINAVMASGIVQVVCPVDGLGAPGGNQKQTPANKSDNAQKTKVAANVSVKFCINQ